MRIGYARVSTPDQSLDLQRDALTAAGCDRVFTDVAGGKSAARPGLDRAREQLRAGDVFVVWRLDRLGRSLRHLIDSLAAFEAAGVGFLSLTEAIDTTTAGGRLVYHVMGALAEFERNLVRDRTQAGLAAARARGRKGGRPKALAAAQQALAVDLYHQKRHTIAEICTAVGVSRPTLYAYIRAADAGPAG